MAAQNDGIARLLQQYAHYYTDPTSNPSTGQQLSSTPPTYTIDEFTATP